MNKLFYFYYLFYFCLMVDAYFPSLNSYYCVVKCFVCSRKKWETAPSITLYIQCYFIISISLKCSLVSLHKITMQLLLVLLDEMKEHDNAAKARNLKCTVKNQTI